MNSTDLIAQEWYRMEIVHEFLNLKRIILKSKAAKIPKSRNKAAVKL